MDGVRLDPRNLLGFKIIADGGSTIRLTSPKIGDKDCPGINQDLTQDVRANTDVGHKPR